jgi:hypothetical protein
MQYLKLVLGAAALLALTGCESPEVRAERLAASEAQAAERDKDKPVQEAYEAARDYIRRMHRRVSAEASRAEATIEPAGERVYRVRTWIDTKSYDGQYTFRHTYVCEVAFDKVRPPCKEEKAPKK